MKLSKKDKDRALRKARRDEYQEIAPHLGGLIHKNKKRYGRSNRRKYKSVSLDDDPG